MKRILLSIVVIGVLLLAACGAPPTGAPTEDEVDRLKDEVAELRAELNELQSSYDTLLSEYNKLKAEASLPTEETEITPPETRIEKLPYSWTEGVFSIMIHEVFKYIPMLAYKEWDEYEVRISYANTSHETITAKFDIGEFKLKTDKGNVYDRDYGGEFDQYHTYAPEETYEPLSLPHFKIHKGEKPVELWLYNKETPEQPSIIFRLETR